MKCIVNWKIIYLKYNFVVINKNVKHNIIGKVKFGVVCTPPFDASSERYDVKP